MLPEEDSPPDGREEKSPVSTGSAPTQETPPSDDHIRGGNALPVDFINTQPLPAAPPGELRQSTCGLASPDDGAPPPKPGLEQQRGSGRSVHSGGSKASALQRPAASAADSCLQLLLACLSCQGSALLLGLLEACSSCLRAPCSPCCRACARCCSAVQEAPVEELGCHAHCHRVMFGSCCEPVECLEFCLDCCEICHRS